MKLRERLDKIAERENKSIDEILEICNDTMMAYLGYLREHEPYAHLDIAKLNDVICGFPVDERDVKDADGENE